MKRAGRYQILPAAGHARTLDSASAAKAGANYLVRGPPSAAGEGAGSVPPRGADRPGDRDEDGSIVWPSDRKVVELGSISLTTVAPDNEALRRILTFNAHLRHGSASGLRRSLVPFRSAVYALSVAHGR